MIYGHKFDVLAKSLLHEDAPYYANKEGKELIEKYLNIIRTLENDINNILKPLIKDPSKNLTTASKRLAIQLIADLNSKEECTKELGIMTRLYAITNGGRSGVYTSNISFNEKDEILKYLEKT